MKYRNKKTLFNGRVYDSKIESQYAAFYQQCEKKGLISNLEEQKAFNAIINSEKVFTYKCDFYFFDKKENKYRIIDIKGVETPVFRLKKKILKALYNLEIEIIKKRI